MSDDNDNESPAEKAADEIFQCIDRMIRECNDDSMAELPGLVIRRVVHHVARSSVRSEPIVRELQKDRLRMDFERGWHQGMLHAITEMPPEQQQRVIMGRPASLWRATPRRPPRGR